MPFIDADQAPIFTQMPNATFTGLAAPSRGSAENAVWMVELDPATPPTVHQLTREQVLVALAGEAHARVGEMTYRMTPGSAVVVPPYTDFSLANNGDAPFRAVAVLPVGAQTQLPDGTAFTPPWAL